MELLKTEYSKSKGKGKLDKVLLKCEEPNYYELTELLYKSQNDQAIILRALYEHKTNIVLKFGILESIEKEYGISQELLELPNFIRYFCTIKCNDNIKNIINNKNTIPEHKMCYYDDNKVGILVMEEHDLGSIENYVWNESNFDMLKNVIKQVIYSTIQAYNKKGFIHGDLHTGNILLKPKRKNEIYYENKLLILNDLEVVIMDFEKSKLNQNNEIRELIKNILIFIASIMSTCVNNELYVNIDIKKISKLKSTFNENINYYDELEKIIDDITL